MLLCASTFPWTSVNPDTYSPSYKKVLNVWIDLNDSHIQYSFLSTFYITTSTVLIGSLGGWIIVAGPTLDYTDISAFPFFTINSEWALFHLKK